MSTEDKPDGHEALADMWKRIHQHDASPTMSVSPGVLNLLCEKELLELMRHIDLMVQGQRRKHTADTQRLRHSLGKAERELSARDQKLSARSQELSSLRKEKEKLKGELEAERRMVALKSEEIQTFRNTTEGLKEDQSIVCHRQLQELQDEMNSLKKSYSTLKQKYSREKSSAKESHQLRTKLQKYTSLAGEWEAERRSFQSEVATLLSHQKTMDNKYSSLQAQTVGYRDQIDRRRQLLDRAEQSSLSEAQRREAEIGRATDTMKAQKVEIERLGEELANVQDECAASGKSFDQAVYELNSAKITIQGQESEIHQLRTELKSQGGLLRLSTEDQKNQAKEIGKLREVIREKAVMISDVLGKNHLEESAALEILKADLLAADQRNRKMMDTENTLRSEIFQLQSDTEGIRQKLKYADRECVQLRKQLHKMMDETKSLEFKDIQNRSSDLKMVEEKMSVLESSHRSTVEQLRRQVESLTHSLKLTEVSSGSRSSEVNSRSLGGASPSLVVQRLNRELEECQQSLQEANVALVQKESELQRARSQLSSLKQESEHLLHRMKSYSQRPLTSVHPVADSPPSMRGQTDRRESERPRSRADRKGGREGGRQSERRRGRTESSGKGEDVRLRNSVQGVSDQDEDRDRGEEERRDSEEDSEGLGGEDWVAMRRLERENRQLKRDLARLDLRRQADEEIKVTALQLKDSAIRRLGQEKDELQIRNEDSSRVERSRLSEVMAMERECAVVSDQLTSTQSQRDILQFELGQSSRKLQQAYFNLDGLEAANVAMNGFVGEVEDLVYRPPVRIRGTTPSLPVPKGEKGQGRSVSPQKPAPCQLSGHVATLWDIESTGKEWGHDPTDTRGLRVSGMSPDKRRSGVKGHPNVKGQRVGLTGAGDQFESGNHQGQRSSTCRSKGLEGPATGSRSSERSTTGSRSSEGSVTGSMLQGHDEREAGGEETSSVVSTCSVTTQDTVVLQKLEEDVSAQFMQEQEDSVRCLVTQLDQFLDDLDVVDDLDVDLQLKEGGDNS